MTQKLIITHTDGTTETVHVECGSHSSARRLPARIGRALQSGAARGVLEFDGLPRTAVRAGSGRWFMRIRKGV